MSSMTGRMPMNNRTGAATGLSGTGYKAASLQQFTPEQMDLFRQVFSHVSPESFTSRLASGDQGQFAELEAPALQQFGQLQSNIANRFSGAGLGGRRSSGFQQAQTSAAQNFAQQLQSQRMGIQRQAIQDLLGNSQMLLGQRPQENFLVQKQRPFWQELVAGLASSGGQAASNAAMMAMMA